MSENGLYVGREVAGSVPVLLEADHLTTHAACLGMTGSGKTGLGIVVLEELARRGVPLLVVDLKGDMVDLLLNFPSLEPEAFAPWLPADSVADHDRGEVAAEQAELWRRGLADWGLTERDVAAVRDGVRWQLVAPGAASVAPLDILPALAAPDGWDPDRDPDGASERVAGVAGALLSLIGRGGDPLTDRDHVLLASIVLEHWRRRDRLDLGGLLASIADPPFSSLGALSLESFFPRPDRLKLVMDLNTLLASPAFRAWTTGIPLEMTELLGTPTAPRATVVSVAHLDERGRLFILGLLASELVAWMRRQPASSGLRALLYVDEVHGILPPHPANPPTKPPLLTLLKQGRAFGVGAWLATQNPVDLDYKALGNAGIKVIGRLITDRDRERALEGLGVGTLDDGRSVDTLVASLGKREFVLVDVNARQRVRTFASRWAMSYLRGPVTLAEMAPLAGARRAPAGDGGPGRGAASSALGEAPPVVSAAVVQRYDADARGAAAAALLVRCRVTVERASPRLSRTQEELWRVPVTDPGDVAWERSERLVHEPTLAERPPAGLQFPRALPGRLDRELPRAPQEFVAWRSRQPLVVMVNPALGLVAEPDEQREAFLARCSEVADRADDAAQDRVRRRYQGRLRALEQRLARERDELGRDREEARARKAEETLGVVEGLFSVLVGSRSVRSASGKAASRMRAAAGRRRMSRRAEGSVVESEREVERIERELEELANELQGEVDSIAEASSASAARIEDAAIRPRAADVVVLEVGLFWTSPERLAAPG